MTSADRAQNDRALQPQGVSRAPFSVLMASYVREQASYLALALRSCIRQSLLPAEIILVLDGPVGTDQHDVIEAFTEAAAAAGVRFVVIPLARNVGLGAALNAGLERCNEPYVARMDSDDVSHAERFAAQWTLLRERPEVDLVATWQAEFEDDPDIVVRLKTVPEDHDSIVRVLRWRNVVSHPSIVVRRDVVRRIGGYRPVLYLEDYDLFMRLIAAGARFHAIQRLLVNMRVTSYQAARRGGWAYAKREAKFRWMLFRRGDISLFNYCVSSLVYACFRMAPVPLKRFMYMAVRRSRFPRGFVKPEPG
jgi:glycosyltransferase involved in cell wall biosynthesis